MHIYHFRTRTWENCEDNSYKYSLTGATPVVYDGKIWVWGGYSTKYHNDMHVFDPKNKKWSEVKQNGVVPQRRWHYSAAVHEGRMYMFGGTFDQTHHTDLHIFDFEKSSWSKCEGKNAPSRPRRRHRQVVWKNKLYIIGGKEDSDAASTILVYDILKNSWSEITENDIDTVRGCSIPSSHDHSLYLKKDEVFLFGCKPYRVMKFNFPERIWIPVIPESFLQSQLWNIPSHHGNPAFFEGSIYFFGGRTAQDQEISNDMWRFIVEEDNAFSDLGELLSVERPFSNVQFVVQGKKIYADRCILWAKCQYFKNLFNNNWLESQQENVQINVPNCSYKVFLLFVICIQMKCGPLKLERCTSPSASS
eukprot:UN28624